ncbi:hypothetical protein F4819DRAFT_477291 [Hypoxylon fuscum]|nr:hypothetical protein F4819DRAFT_477291 [Hypoxylon fuscum]
MVRALKGAVEESLGFPTQAASVCVPNFPGLYDEDLYDAMKSFLKEDVPPILDKNRACSPARGVAELVQRSVFLLARDG